jgi:hypothetical protein
MIHWRWWMVLCNRVYNRVSHFPNWDSQLDSASVVPTPPCVILCLRRRKDRGSWCRHQSNKDAWIVEISHKNPVGKIGGSIDRTRLASANHMMVHPSGYPEVLDRAIVPLKWLTKQLFSWLRKSRRMRLLFTLERRGLDRAIVQLEGKSCWMGLLFTLLRRGLSAWSEVENYRELRAQGLYFRNLCLKPAIKIRPMYRWRSFCLVQSVDVCKINREQ